MYQGKIVHRLNLPTAVAPIEWHIHELLYGYVPAVISGILLTALPNRTGRLPVAGRPLLALFMIWLAGQLAVFGSLWAGPWTAGVIDLLFLGALGAIGLMTLAVITRASLGHTGQALTATIPIEAIYGAGMLAAFARIAAAFAIQREPMLRVSATSWVLAFLGFAVIYAPLLLRSRQEQAK